MHSLFLWEIGTPLVYITWVVVFVAQVAISEINRRWNWTIFFLWTFGGLALMPYAALHGTPMVGWFPFGKYVIMVDDGFSSVVRKAKPGQSASLRHMVWRGTLDWARGEHHGSKHPRCHDFL